MYHAIRLRENDDLKKCLKEYVKEHNIEAGCVLSGVGCVKHAHIRLVKAVSFLDEEKDYEIVSITGIVSKERTHVHLSLSDETGATFGGHLADGTIINTTCELVIL